MTDWESLYELASDINVIAVCVIYGVVFSLFCLPFVKRRIHVLAAGAALSGTLLFLWMIPVEVGNFTVYGLSTLAGIFTLWAQEQNRRRQKLFLAITFFSVRWMTMAIGNCLYVWLDKVSLKIPHYSESQELQFKLFLANIILNALVDFGLLLVISWIIGKVYKYKEDEMNRSEFLLMLIPSLSGLVGYAMMKYYDNNYKADTGYALSEISTQFNLMRLCYYVISLSTIIVLIVLYQNIREKQEEAKQRELLNGQIESMKHHIGRVEHLYADIRGLRHDMGNHITTLEALYETGQTKAAGEYMEELKQNLRLTDNEVKSGNPVTDVILSERKQEAREEGIEFVCDFHYPKSDKINAFDISVILNNALDNAIRAAKGVAEKGACPKILVRSYAKDDVYMLEIENDFEQDQGSDIIKGREAEKREVEQKTETVKKAEAVKKTEMIRKTEMVKETEMANKTETMNKTEKLEGENHTEHGYGLLNIRRVAQKYCGDMLIERMDGVFRLSVMLVL